MSATIGDLDYDRVLIEDCVRAATLAPSVYNSQPWRFRIAEGCMDVLLDPLRSLPAVDPSGREMHISLGAAVLNVKVMLAAHGVRADVSLLPDPAEPDLVARIGRGDGLSPTLREVAMVSALARRQTTRSPFQNRGLPPLLVQALNEAAVSEGGHLTVLEQADAQGLLALARTAESRLRADPSYRKELGRWTADHPGRRDGVLPDLFGTPSLDDSLPLRDFTAHQPWRGRDPEKYEEHPTIAVLWTQADGREDWLRAGMALERVLLEATIAGVSASFFTQPLEVEELRRRCDAGTPRSVSQMVMRLGYPRQPGAARSPRRSLADVLIEVR